MANGNAELRQQGVHPSCVDKNEWMAAVLADENLVCSAVKVAVRLALHHNTTTGQCNPSIETLARGTNLKARAVHNAISALRDAGFLTWTTPAGGSSNYRLKRIVIGRQRDAADVRPSAPDAATAPLRGDAGGGDLPLHGGAGEGCTGMQGDPCTVVHTNPGNSNPGREPVSTERECDPVVRRSDEERPTFRQNTTVSRFPQILPGNFILTRPRAHVAMALGITSHQEIRDAFQKFQLHHQSKGTKSADWEASWKLWCVNHQEFKKRDVEKRQISRPAI
ncbi:UNVERIFIED_ORG: hypothetical protein J2W74_003926 [Methylorubrum zatmanii]